MSETLPIEVRNLEPETRGGYCQCGCGRLTTVPIRNDFSKGWMAGVPLPYCNGHFRRKPKRYEVDSVTGCWNWLSTVSPNGYAGVFIGGKRWTVHRLIYETLNGPVPEHLDLDHLCRNRRCVNPEHLRVVTRHVNSQCGAKAKLNPELVVEIRRMREEGKSMGLIARQFGISCSCVQGVLNRTRWGNIE